MVVRCAVVCALVLAAGCGSPSPGTDELAPSAREPAARSSQTDWPGEPSPDNPTADSPTNGITYADRIRPMLEQPCLGCHGRWFPQAGLSMESRDTLVKGGRSGPAIVPGDSNKGWLIHAITTDAGRYRMPPQGQQLSADQVDLVRRWIDAGAP